MKRGRLFLFIPLIVFGWLIMKVSIYRPALGPASGFEVQWVTRPDFVEGIVKSFDRLVEVQPCQYRVLGWDAENKLYYTEICVAHNQLVSQAWKYDPAQPQSQAVVSSMPPMRPNMSRLPRQNVLDAVRAYGVRPVSAEFSVRQLYLKGGGEISPDGKWLVIISQHLYGPQDVLVLYSHHGFQEP